MKEKDVEIRLEVVCCCDNCECSHSYGRTKLYCNKWNIVVLPVNKCDYWTKYILK